MAQGERWWCLVFCRQKKGGTFLSPPLCPQQGCHPVRTQIADFHPYLCRRSHRKFGRLRYMRAVVSSPPPSWLPTSAKEVRNLGQTIVTRRMKRVESEPPRATLSDCSQ